VKIIANILAFVVLVVIHVSATPTPPLDAGAQGRCLSFAEAGKRGLNIGELRQEYAAAVTTFPNQKTELAESWKELQYTLRDRIQESSVKDLSGQSVFSMALFEPDGRIAWVFHRGLEADEEALFCEVVEELAEEYRFPLTSSTRFSQCGTTHFKDN
jgi:hypothetical protein